MFFQNKTNKISEEEKVSEKLQKRDKILEEIGCYVNLNAVEKFNLFSVERIHLLSNDGDITEVNFLNENGELKSYELFISRKDHKQLVDKLNNIN